MSDAYQEPQSFDGTPQAAARLDSTALWLAMDDDLALGCESAYPWLQIERWSHEAAPAPHAP